MRRTLAVVVLSLCALIGLPSAVHAGGPTSVLITQPGAEQSTALYYTSPDYALLERLLTADPTTTTGLPIDLDEADQYNLTWMIHDVQPWRRDTLYVTDGGTAYVTTAISDGEVESEVVQSKGRMVKQGKALAALLDRVFSGAATTEPAAQQVLEQEPAAAPAEPVTRWFSLTGWRWAVPGVLGGLLVGLVATRRREPAEPRRTLVDREPERAGA